MKTDAQLKSAIQDELRWEPAISSCDIDVATRNGIVTLSGTVPHYAEKWAAEKAIQRVEGVSAIVEEREVNLTESAAVVGGFSEIGAALVCIGIPNNSILQYEGSIRSRQFLMVVNGTCDEIERAKVLLSNSGAPRTQCHTVKEPAAAMA